MSEKITRIRVRMGTVDLPNRQLKDNERTVDIIDVPLEPGEHIQQIDLEKQYGYSVVRMSNPETGVEVDKPARDRNADRWRYRAVTTQEIDYTSGDDEESVEVTDAEIVAELEPGDHHD